MTYPTVADGDKASRPRDLGVDAIAGFQTAWHAGARPYERSNLNRRAQAVDGGGFQTAVKRDDERLPVAGKPIATDDE
jgi:hypothetical protein